jgi:hypothetical protein
VALLAYAIVVADVALLLPAGATVVACGNGDEELLLAWATALNGGTGTKNLDSSTGNAIWFHTICAKHHTTSGKTNVRWI